MATRKVRDVIADLSKDGWTQTSQRGSHRQFEHPNKPGKVTVAGHESDDLPSGTVASIERQAGWRVVPKEAIKTEGAKNDGNTNENISGS